MATTVPPLPATSGVRRRFWAGPWARPAFAGGIAALAGLLVALAMPSGPATSGQALAAMALGLAVGLVAGAIVRSRWAMLLAPAAHIVAIELARLPVAGPTVDAIRLDTACSPRRNALYST